MEPFKPISLVGLYFLVPNKERPTKRESRFQYQGRVVGQINEVTFIVNYYEWIAGTAHSMAAVPLGDIIEDKWEFWEHHEDWVNRCAGKL